MYTYIHIHIFSYLYNYNSYKSSTCACTSIYSPPHIWFMRWHCCMICNIHVQFVCLFQFVRRLLCSIDTVYPPQCYCIKNNLSFVFVIYRANGQQICTCCLFFLMKWKRDVCHIKKKFLLMFHKMVATIKGTAMKIKLLGWLWKSA